MKKLMNLMAYAAIVFLGVFLSMSLCSCGNDESFSDNRIAPVPTPTPTNPDPAPEKKDSTGYKWDTCMDQTVDFDESTEEVTAINKWQVTINGTPDFVDAVMRYKYEIDFTAPTRVVTSAQDTTAYAGGGLFKSDYSNYRRADKDSLWDVNSYIEGGYKTQYYTMSLKTSRMEGIDCRGGKENRYFNVSEKPIIKSIWHEPLKEVEVNDSTFNRETVHNVLLITLTGTKGNKWYVKREKVVIVDHFIKKIEEEPTPAEPEKVEADDYQKGLSRFVSATKVYNPDKKLWGDAYLFEGSESYKIVICWYNKDDKPQGKSFYEINFGTCPKSNDYNAVAYIRGNFYPGLISHDGKTWAVGCYVNGSGESQLYDSNHVDLAGIKNFKDNNSAYPTPYIPNTPDVKTVNGVKVISVTGKTSVHTSKVTIADSLLKK